MFPVSLADTIDVVNHMGRYLLVSFVLLMAGAVVLTRLLPHPPNFTPVGALALFAGMYITQKTKWGLLVPLVVLFTTDIFIGTYEWKLMAVVYLSFLAYVGIGALVAKKKHIATVLAGTLGGATLFYLTTNFAVWALNSAAYEPTLAGLMASYTMALPFFKFTLLGDVFFVAVFIGSYELAVRYVFKESFAKKKEVVPVLSK